MPKETILEEAARITSEDRNLSYGHPADNHEATALFWRVYLKRKYNVIIPLSPRDVCWMDILQKISRDANQPKRDNVVDTAGFARNIEQIEERES